MYVQLVCGIIESKKLLNYVATQIPTVHVVKENYEELALKVLAYTDVYTSRT